VKGLFDSDQIHTSKIQIHYVFKKKSYKARLTGKCDIFFLNNFNLRDVIV